MRVSLIQWTSSPSRCQTLRSKVLKQLHEGHQCLTRCCVWARMSVSWPHISAEITKTAATRRIWIKNKPTQRSEPLLITPLPGGPWQHIAADLCELERQNYLIVTDYYSGNFGNCPPVSHIQPPIHDQTQRKFARWGCRWDW